jgi:hypothetical protein
MREQLTPAGLLTEAAEADYSARLVVMDDDEYLRETFNVIDRANGSSVYSINDQRATLCAAEGRRRNRPDLYQKAFTVAYRMAKGDQWHGRAWEALTA